MSFDPIRIRRSSQFKFWIIYNRAEESQLVFCALFASTFGKDFASFAIKHSITIFVVYFTHSIRHFIDQSSL